MAQLIVTRATGIVAFFERLEVDVDESAYGTLARGERGRYGIHVGRHTVTVRTMWVSGSLDIDCEEDDVVYVRAKAPPVWYWMLLPIYVILARRHRFYRLEIDELGRYDDPEAAPEDDTSPA